MKRRFMKWDMYLTDFRIVTLPAFLKNVLTLSMDGREDRPSTEIMFVALIGPYCPVTAHDC